MLSALLPLLPSVPTPNFGPHFTPSTQENMNGAYPFSPMPGGTPGKFPKRFRDYPGGVESFDVYTPPMTTLYSQVRRASAYLLPKLALAATMHFLP